MKSKFSFLTILLAFWGLSIWVIVPAQTYEWTEMASFPYALYSPASFCIDSNIYFVSGAVSIFPKVLSNQVWQYNINSNSWIQKNNFPGPTRYGAHAFVIGNYAYVVCGWDDSGTSAGLKDCWRYDPSTDTWLKILDFPGSPRYNAATFTLNGKGYVACGYAPYKNDMYSYDPIANNWDTSSSFPGSPRNNPVFFTSGNYAYCGMGTENTGGNLRDFYKYDPFIDSWSQLNNFPGKGLQATYQFELDSVVFVGMGQEYDTNLLAYSATNTVWKYNPTTDNWDTSAFFPDSAIFEGGYASYNGFGYAGVGAKDFNWNSSSYTNTFWRFGPVNNTCTVTIYVTDTNFVTVTDTVIVYDSIAVSDTLIINTVLTSVNPPNNENDLKVYPNPTKTHIYVDNGNFSLMNGYTLKITNSLSQTVFQSTINQQQFYIDLSGWTGNGTYFISVIDPQSNTIDIRKIILK